MSKKLCLSIMLLVLFLNFNDLSGQSFKYHFNLNGGLATTSMNDYKLFLERGEYNLPVDPMTFGDFDPSPFLSYTLTFSQPSGFFFGFGNGLFTTWTRLHYSDYSGEYLLDWQVNGTSVHLKIGGTEQVFKNTNLEFYGKPEFMYSDIKFEERIVVYDIEEKFTDKYHFWQFMGEAGIDMIFLTNRRVKPFIEVAYCGLLYSSDNEVHDPPNWSGIRASLGIRFSFDKRETKAD